MARKSIGLRGGKAPSPSIEPYEGWDITAQDLTANTLAEVPTTIREGRQFIIIQNISNTDVFVSSGGIPDLYIWKTSGFDSTITCTRKYLKWTESGATSDEYYAEAKAGGDPGLTQPLRVYGITTSGGSEAVLTEGTVGSLNNLEWVWNDGTAETPALGYSTIYFRFDAGDPDDSTYLTLYGYQSIPTVTGAGHHIGRYDDVHGSITSAVRIFAISATNSSLIISQFVPLIQY